LRNAQWIDNSQARMIMNKDSIEDDYPMKTVVLRSETVPHNSFCLFI
jgi:hypothetical protein